MKLALLFNNDHYAVMLRGTYIIHIISMCAFIASVSISAHVTVCCVRNLEML